MTGLRPVRVIALNTMRELLRNKLLYLAVFVSSLPLVFSAASFLYKFDRMISSHGFVMPSSEMVSLYIWSAGVVM